jgi:hypothetical protein
MWKGILHLNQFATRENTIESFVCFKKFIGFLEDKVQQGSGSRNYFYQFVLDKVRAYPQLSSYVDIEEIQEYDDVLELVASIVFSLTDDEDEVLIGLVNAASPEAFYSTNAFRRLFQQALGNSNSPSWMDENALLEIHKEYQYSLVLQNIYGQALPQRKEMIYGYLNEQTGLYTYHRLNFDTRFVDITIKPSAEKLSDHLMNSCFLCSNPLAQVEKLISLDEYRASGFAILSLTDVTAQQAVEQIGKTIVNFNQEQSDKTVSYIGQLLQSIIGTKDFRFGIMPFYTINNRAALPYKNLLNSILIEVSAKAGISKKVFTRYMSHYLKKPEWITYPSTSIKSQLPVTVQKALYNAGIRYYSLAPLFFNNCLVGVLEIAGDRSAEPIDELTASRLNPAMPYLSQLMKLLIEKFDVAIDKIVQEKFTNIQPSVQWKFNEVAWHYFRSRDIEHETAGLEKVFFKEVSPFYGAVDIRNSTTERNKALREDLQFQLMLLTSLLNGLHRDSTEEFYDSLADECMQWLDKMQDYVSVEEEIRLNDFLHSKVHPLLASVNLPGGAYSKEIETYFKSTDELSGQCFTKRRALENAMQSLNGAIGKYFELFNEELQLNYPCYFEKFRTDGIEYDIYIGQSIAPTIPFSFSYLDKLRLWQLQSMAAITKLTHHMLPELEYPLQTTQLIFVNPSVIDISFRNDERRFDVEGAYNIRYQVIKKRIDKVLIRNTNERLTQLGKIAIVYFYEKDIASYIEKINLLQEQQTLSADLEYLDLEELQGVAGLKALRVGVEIN